MRLRVGIQPPKENWDQYFLVVGYRSKKHLSGRRIARRLNRIYRKFPTQEAVFAVERAREPDYFHPTYYIFYLRCDFVEFIKENDRFFHEFLSPPYREEVELIGVDSTEDIPTSVLQKMKKGNVIPLYDRIWPFALLSVFGLFLWFLVSVSITGYFVSVPVALYLLKRD